MSWNALEKVTEQSNAKDPWLAALLSDLLPGLGLLYGNRIFMAVCFALVEILSAFGGLYMVVSYNGNVLLGYLVLMGALLAHIADMFVAYYCCGNANSRKHQVEERKTRDPYLSMILSNLWPGLGQIHQRRWISGTLFLVVSVVLLLFQETLVVRILKEILYGYVTYEIAAKIPVRYRPPSRIVIGIVALGLMGNLTFVLSEQWVTTHCVGYAFLVGRSNEPVLLDGDVALLDIRANKELRRGSHIAIHSKRYFDGRNAVKRLIALGGDEVELKRDGIYVNGRIVRENPTGQSSHLPEALSVYANPGSPYAVPEGHAFVVGDNLQESYDSRTIGAIPTEDIIGVVYKVVWPPSRIRSVPTTDVQTMR